MMKKPVIIFLYTEIAAYITACWQELQKTTDVHVIRYPINKEAPFVFSESNEVKFYDRKQYTYGKLKELIENLKPDAIFCSGWIDKDYLRICKIYSGKIPTVLCMDTKWQGTFKQQVAALLSPLLIKPKFSHAWVPGKKQKEYAEKLGFETNKISEGYYCADTLRFYSSFEKHRNAKKTAFPKVFIYAGRYYDFKGITDLWDAFIQLKNEKHCNWELWCLGTGDITPIVHPAIKHFGFIQPDKMDYFLERTGVFILPSRFEPWAVAVHEFAAAGFPLVISDQVGAAEFFLKEGENGFEFKAGNITDLKEKLRLITECRDEKLNLMCDKSAEMGITFTPEKWALTAIKITGL